MPILTKLCPLTEEEFKKIVLDTYGVDLNEPREHEEEIIAHVKEYFPASAAIIKVSYQSYYNDETHNKRIEKLTVLDKEGKTLESLSEEKEYESRYYLVNKDCGEDFVEEEVFIINKPKLPVLYEGVEDPKFYLD
jgi:hypothetical protein